MLAHVELRETKVHLAKKEKMVPLDQKDLPADLADQAQEVYLLKVLPEILVFQDATDLMAHQVSVVLQELPDTLERLDNLVKMENLADKDYQVYLDFQEMKVQGDYQVWLAFLVCQASKVRQDQKVSQDCKERPVNLVCLVSTDHPEPKEKEDPKDVLVKTQNLLLSTAPRVQEDLLDLLVHKVNPVCLEEMVQVDDQDKRENKVSQVLKVLLAFLVTVVNLDLKDLSVVKDLPVTMVILDELETPDLLDQLPTMELTLSPDIVKHLRSLTAQKV